MTHEQTQREDALKAWINEVTGSGQDATYPMRSAYRDGWMDCKRLASSSTATTEAEQYKRMFLAACSDLGLINEALGLDPNDGGAEPILSAIAELKDERDQWVDAQFASASSTASVSEPDNSQPIGYVNIRALTQLAEGRWAIINPRIEGDSTMHAVFTRPVEAPDNSQAVALSEAQEHLIGELTFHIENAEGGITRVTREVLVRARAALSATANKESK